MKYENLKKFIISTKASKNTIYRFYKKNEDLFTETKKPNGKRLFPTDQPPLSEGFLVKRQMSQTLRLQSKSIKKPLLIANGFWIL